MNRQIIRNRALDLRRALALGALALLAALAVCAAPTARAHAAAADPIEISTAEQLRAIAAGDSGASYVLTADIDLGGAEWMPIGAPSSFNDGRGTGFRGTFDGNGHAISNLAISSFSVGGGGNDILYAGLFGCTNGATIKNLTLDSPHVAGTYSKGSDERDLMVGALVGLAVNTNISSCTVVNATVTDRFDGERADTKNYAIGGIVGDFYTDGKSARAVSNCSMAGTVSTSAKFPDFKVADDTPIQAFTGGIVGRVRERGEGTASVVNCMFDGKVAGSGFVGPFVAGARSQNSEREAADISLLAAYRSIDCCYAGSIAGVFGPPNKTYNCGPGVWNGDVYVPAKYVVNDGNRAAALESLNQGAGDGAPWRIASREGRELLVLDYRKVVIDSLALEGGKAKLSAALKGFDAGAELSWSVDGEVRGTGATFEVPIALRAQTVEASVQAGDRRFSDSRDVEAAHAEFSLAKKRDAAGDVESLTVNLRSASDGFSADDFDYAWQGVKDGRDIDLGVHDATLDRSRFDGFESFKVVVASKASGERFVELTATTSGRTVYLNWSKGDDGNHGYEPAEPVKTMQRAFEQLKDNASREGNVVVVMDQYAGTEFGYDDKTFNKPATITSYDADYGVDYRSAENGGAFLSLYNTSTDDHKGADSTRIKGKLLFADTTFKDITLSAKGGGDSKWRIGYLYCQGHSLTMDTGVRMEGYRNTSEAIKSYGLLSGTRSQDFNIVGGYANYNEDPSKGYPQDRGTCEIVIRSGSYGRVIAGGRNYDCPDNGGTGVNGISHNQFATEKEPFNVSVTVDIAAGQSMVTTGEATCDIGQLTGGQTDGTIYSNSAITLKSGVVPLVFGSSIGYNRSVNSNGTTYPNNDFVGRVQVNVEGGSAAQLYGGCLGRTASNAKEKVDARFLSSRYTPRELPDIEINVTGGTIGKIPNIGDDGALAGVFAAGAGGITGKGDPETGAVDNAVDIALNISGGTIAGKLYGGGYGQPSAVTDAKLACLEAGNLYGDSTVNITGGDIRADVYGGGAGTAAYLAGNPDANALAQIVGDVKLSIGKAQIDGTVYGGSQGVVQQGFDCTAMAKIAGNVELSIGNGAHVTGDVYGGSALGTVAGSATTMLAAGDGASRVDGSVYGGGEGALVADYALDRQLAVGAVEGSTTLSIKDSAVGGDVYGGGSRGAVLGGTSVEVRGSSVGGGAYAAGEGSYLGEGNKDAALQKAIGWVKGDASLVLADGASVAGSVFGGGSLGVVGDGALGSGTVPYTIDDPADIAVIVENAQVGGSVFGGGAGDVNTAGQMPRLLGAVFGTARVVVHEGSIGSDVFGGGDQSYSYAPLGGDGVPQRAATVVVNGGDALYVHSDDGRVADGPEKNVREVDAAPGDASTQRAISLGGSVFGGGNIADPHTVSASSYTVYGAAEVFIKGFGVNFTNGERGGVYGDGNLSRVYGARTVTLVRLRTPLEDGTMGAKGFFSLQRANRAVVHDCSILLHGAKDLVNESDRTDYSLNRVGALNVYAGSTIQFDTVVNGLGSLYSDVLPERTFTSEWGGLEMTEYGDNLTNDEKNDCRRFTRGDISSWYDELGGEHHWTNTLVVNTGKWLDVKDPSDTADARYGSVTGLFSLTSSTVRDGGSFVYAQSTPKDSAGAFVSLNESGEVYRPPYLEIYTKRSVDVDGKECRIWFIEGSSYVYQRELRAFTTGDTVSIRTQLPVKRPDDGKMDIWVGGDGISIDRSLENMQRSANKGPDDKYAVSMTIGDSDVLPLFQGGNDWWHYNYERDVVHEETALLPATITLDIAELAADAELSSQSGLVRFTLAADDGTKYRFEIEIVLERAYAVAYETAHYGRVYENIAVENMTPITPTSSYTTQFTTTYSPGAYRSEVEAELSANTSAAVHGEEREGGTFPEGTKLTLVNITNPTSPAFYYYECDRARDTVPLAEFASMADGSPYKNPTGNTVIVENLLVVVDYSQANDGDGRGAGTTHIALNHRYGSGAVENDILRYPYVDDEGNRVERYNNLWNGYEVADVPDRAYLGSQLLNPDTGASSSPVKVGRTDNFMYDTYTTKLVLDENAACVSTLFDESEVMLQVSLQGRSNWGWLSYQNKTFPLGTRLVVKRPDGTVASERYFNEKTDWGSDGYLMVNLGTRLEREYTVELQVARYVAGGALDTVFNWLWPSHSGDLYRLNADLYVSADGLHRSTGERYAHHEAEFEAARNYNVKPPEYELESKYKDSLEYKDGQVQGSITLKGDKKNNVNSDAQMTVLRRPAGSEYAPVDITALGGTVTREAQGNSGHTKFTVTDHPASGTYEYEIRLGNTVYYQTVAVP